MNFQRFAPLAAIVVAAAGCAQQRASPEAYAEWYLYRCQQITSNWRMTCFDLLPARIPGYRGNAYDAPPASKI